MINAGNAEWFAIDEIATAIGGWCARRMQCRVGKIAGHCDDDCAKLRDFAHAVAARGRLRGRRAGMPRRVVWRCGA
jgi:hypothetical protein